MAQKTQQGPVPKRGLITDTSHLNQPPGALTFALNVVNESEDGDMGWRSNEQSNEPCYTLTSGYIPLGEIYIDKNDSLLLSVSEDGTMSEIGIIGVNCQYTVLVNADLGFKAENQISGTYRLRRGCERTFYFTTPTPMLFNMDKLNDFKVDETDSDSDWDPAKFKLFKVYESIPTFQFIEVIENGLLAPGSYNASIQYLDNDLNPTEWITTCEPIKIYNDSVSKKYSAIEGSTNVVNAALNFGLTNKAIKFSFTDFDTSYPYYRVAIISSNTGSGLVNEVTFSSPISTNIKTYTHTGSSSTVTTGTENEILAFNNVIEEAEFVEQIENKLILGKTKGVQINFCGLQKYASKIKSDVRLEETTLNIIGGNNPKTATVNFDGVGYMPGEIYSFGIVYIFEGSILSPVFHIPGKAEGHISSMSDNNLLDSPYQSTSCKGFWGLDSQGGTLLGQPIRHHRFPTRSEINEPLFTEDTNAESFTLNNLVLTLSASAVTGTTISYEVSYKIDGTPKTFNTSFLSSVFDPAEGLERTVATTRGVITEIIITEDIDGAGYTEITPGVESTSGVTYAQSIVARVVETEDAVYTSKIMGITFSGITVPEEVSTNGYKVIGYYIVRNERTEDEKTVLDSGVMTPMMLEERGFVAHGHIFPNLSDTSRIDKDIFGLIHPENKFNGLEYKNLTQITQEGEYRIVSQALSSVLTQDVGAGTSYDPDVHKGFDGDGITLHTLTRDTKVSYHQKTKEWINPEKRGEVFYLNALNYKTVKDSDDKSQDVYNVSGDNKIGIVQLEEDITDVNDIHKKLPYVMLKRDLSSPYGSFRTLQYYKENVNPIYFDTTTEDKDDVTKNGEQAYILNGDSYIAPMKYHSALFNNFSLADRDTKSSFWTILAGVLLVVVGVAGALISGGSSLALAATGLAALSATAAVVVTAVSIAAIGYGLSTLSSGIEMANVIEVYQKMYEAGLRDTIQDDDTKTIFDDRNQADDEFQWLGDVVSNLWFESGVNIALRNGVTSIHSAYIDAPTAMTDYYPETENLTTNSIEGYLRYMTGAGSAPQNYLDSYMLEKLTVVDAENSDGRLYRGYAGAEIYALNRDYQRTNKQKIFYALGLEYDCCSNCTEDFPHRTYYSEQSFQEELIDNYRVFLPNNYRDLEGEKGVITDLFRIQNNLYIQTEGALWHLPQTIQERVTGDVVSFIGTGEFFAIPPRKITDTDKESAGTLHNWARMKTPSGVFFVSATEGKVYLFDGNSLQPIVGGNETWFKNNLPVKADLDYLISSGVNYPLANNPSSKFGTGFISTYDTQKERFILTKKDYVLSSGILDSTDYITCSKDGQIIIFEPVSEIIAARLADGWNYEGLEDCKMKFSSEVVTQTTEIIQTETIIANKADIHVFFDTSGSFDVTALGQIDNTIDAWLINFRASNPSWTGDVFKYNDQTERWVTYADIIATDNRNNYNGITSDKDVVVISFCNEASPSYHSSANTLQATTTAFLDDYDKFTGTNLNGNNPAQDSLYSSFKSFKGIHYPIVFPNDHWTAPSQAFVLNSLAALRGTRYTFSEVNALTENLGFASGAWDILKASLQEPNSYPNNGLENFGWLIKHDRFKDAQGSVIDTTEFTNDITLLLEGSNTTVEEQVLVNVIDTVVDYTSGRVESDPIQYDLSWTMSYSLKDKEWVSWHSYTPNFYFYRLQEHYSWRSGDSQLWKHNKANHYQTFYGVRHPHIIEYVDNKKPRETKIWDYLNIQSHAQEFNPTYQDYVDKDITFNKLIAYTSKQSTGLVNLVVKDEELDYLDNQVVNNVDSILVDRTERDWHLNDLRDVVVDYTLPLFRRDNLSLQSEHYTDKVLNTIVLDYNKEWNELQSFRDKYLVLRLIFDNFDNIKLITNFTEEIEHKSFS